MPNALIKKYSEKLHKSEKELEKIWKEAKAASIKDGIKETDKKFYAYTVTIFKRMNGINDEDEYPMGLKEGKVMSFSEFLMSESDRKTKDSLSESIVSDKFEAAQKAIGEFWHTVNDLSTKVEDLDRKTWNELRSDIAKSMANLAKCSDKLRVLGIE
jgi:hypothetical protein